MDGERRSKDIREGVRAGIIATLERDVELRGGRTARLLAAAGAIGVLGAVGVALMLSGHPFGHHPSWHIVVFTAVWAGLLVVSLSLVFLRVRSPSLPIASAASVGIVGLGLAGICGVLCPDPHFLSWWSETGFGRSAARAGGAPLSAFCLGVVATLFVSLVSALLVLGRSDRGPVSLLLPAIALTILLAPGVALQSVDTSLMIFASWLVGTFAGAVVGVGVGARLRARLTPA